MKIKAVIVLFVLLDFGLFNAAYADNKADSVCCKHLNKRSVAQLTHDRINHPYLWIAVPGLWAVDRVPEVAVRIGVRRNIGEDRIRSFGVRIRLADSLQAFNAHVARDSAALRAAPRCRTAWSDRSRGGMWIYRSRSCGCFRRSSI